MERDIYQKIINSIKSITEKINALSESEGSTGEAIGDLTALTTTAKTNLVAAINEVDDNIDDVDEKIGALTDLTTTAKTNLVAAINEVKGLLKSTEVEVTTTAGGDAQLFNTEKVVVFAAQKTSTDFTICLPYLYQSKTKVRILDFSNNEYAPWGNKTCTLRVWYYDL